MDDGAGFGESESRFAEAVRELRLARGWSQGDLAEHLVRRGISDATQVTVSRLESGKRAVRLSEAQAIAAIFGRPLGTLTSPGPLSVAIDRARRLLGKVRRSHSELHDVIERQITNAGWANEIKRDLQDAMEQESDAESLAFAQRLINELDSEAQTSADKFADAYRAAVAMYEAAAGAPPTTD